MSTTTPTGHAVRAPAEQPESAVDAVLAVCRRAREAARVLALADRSVKDSALHAIAEALVAATAEIVGANAKDLARGAAEGLPANLLDRLTLDAARVAAIAAAVRDVAALPDPVGEVVRGSTLPNGLRLRQVRVPMGVIGMVYEARPNVTVDAAALALKSGNAAVLRGGSAALESNAVLVGTIRAALVSVGLPADAVTGIDAWGRGGVQALMRARGLVDLLVPRGGAGLIRTVVENATVPVIETGTGNCHVYVDARADLDQALAVTINAKTRRTSVCNAAETVLVHAAVAEPFLSRLLPALAAQGVGLHVDERVAVVASAVDVATEPATDEDWAVEYLAPELAVGVVDDIGAAIAHIRRWSSGHTEAICTTDLRAADRFTAEVDSAVVMVNASTAFTDGAEFGLGAEVGISTQKLHARGPMGLAELTSTKWIVTGDGQVRPPLMEATEVRKLTELEDRHWWYRERRRLLARSVADLAPGTALDVGAAGGGNTRVLRDLGWSAAALEFGVEGAQVCAERSLAVVRADATRLPIASGSLDLVVAFDVLEHLDDDKAAATGVFDALRPGGHFLVAVPADPRLWSAHDDAVGHVRRYTRQSLSELLAGAGFELGRMTSWNVLLRPVVALRRRSSTGSDLDSLPGVVNTGLGLVVAAERYLPVQSWPGVSLLVRCRRPSLSAA